MSSSSWRSGSALPTPKRAHDSFQRTLHTGGGRGVGGSDPTTRRSFCSAGVRAAGRPLRAEVRQVARTPGGEAGLRTSSGAGQSWVHRRRSGCQTKGPVPIPLTLGAKAQTEQPPAHFTLPFTPSPSHSDSGQTPHPSPFLRLCCSHPGPGTGPYTRLPTANFISPLIHP